MLLPREVDVDDESGWNEILVDGWGPLVRAAVCDRVEDALATSRGVLGRTVLDPDHAERAWVERVHAEVLAAIEVETGARLDDLGSQSAWATYDDVWGELARRWDDGRGLEPVADDRVPTVVGLLAGLPPEAVLLAGATRRADGVVELVHAGGRHRLDVEGLFRWLATDERADTTARERARAVVAAARGR